MYQMAYTVMYPLHDLLWMNQELIILISMASYRDELNQENDHSIFVSENDNLILYFVPIPYLYICLFIVDNYDKYHFCIFSLIKFGMIRVG